MTDPDMDPAFAQALAAVAQLRTAAEQLASTVSSTRTEISDDGLVTVTAARGRLSTVDIAPRAFDVTEHVPHHTLVVDLLDAAQRALSPEPARVGDTTTNGPAAAQVDHARVQEFADREFHGTAGDGQVSATVNGGSRLLNLDVASGIADTDDRSQLGAFVVAAVDAALAECASARAAAFGLVDPSVVMREKTDALVERLAKVDAEMTTLRVGIRAQIEQAHALRGPTATDGQNPPLA